MLLFGWIDYALFTFMLSISALIGIYYGCFGSKMNTTKEYLHGGKAMKVFPIAVSLVASHLSGITLLGLPAEIYFHGTQYWVCILSTVIVSLSIIYVYLPVFYKLQLNSSYEYLKLRFDHKVRSLASILYVLATLLYVPIVIYVPALAFNQVTGIDFRIICPILCLVCIFYTTLGGLKAVVLTDTLQFMSTLVTMAMVFVIGTVNCGGIGAVWQKAAESGRIEFFNMSLDPFERTTFWTIILGMTTTWISNLGVNPSSVQRFLAVPSFDHAKKSVWIFGIGTIITKSISIFSGLIMFATYVDCDPFSAGDIKRVDQLLPYYVLHVAGHIKGLPGLFIAGVFSTALSTMSTAVNTLAGTIYEDFVKSRMPLATTEKTASNVMKGLAVVIGLTSLGIIYIIEKLGGVLELSLSFHSITLGPLLGIITLGMLFPSANKHGAFWGGVLSTIFISILVGGVQYYKHFGIIKHPHKPLSTSGCDSNVTFINNQTVITEPEKPLWPFLISFYYFTTLAALMVIIMGLLISWATRTKGDSVDPNLLSPLVHRFLPESEKRKLYECETVQMVNKSDTNDNNVDDRSCNKSDASS